MLLTSRENGQSTSRLSITSTNSTGRICRKNDSTGKRSLSREKSKQHLEESSFESYYKNYMKRSCQNAQSPTAKIKNAAVSNISIPSNGYTRVIPGSQTSRTQYKRQPTPVKSRLEINRPAVQKQSINFQNELKLAQFQTKLNKQKVMREKLEKETVRKDKKLQQYTSENSKLTNQNRQLFKQNIELKDRILILQKSIFQSETHLNAANNTLNKLKKTIKENRISELQYTIKDLSQKNTSLVSENQNLLQENQNLLKDLTKSMKQNEQLKKKVDLVTKHKNQSMRQTFLHKQLSKIKEQLETNKTQKQLFLQEQIKKLTENIFNIHKQKNSLSIKIHYMEHSSNKSFHQLKYKKDQEIKKLKVKYCEIIQNLKQRYNNSPQDSPRLAKKNTSPTIPNHILQRNRKRSQVLLQLSPE